MNSITSHELAQLQAKGQAFALLDVRRDKARQSGGTQIAHAQWHNPAHWLDWKDEVPKDLPIVLYCAHEGEISQGLTTALQVMGLNARFLDGGLAAWKAGGLATEPVV